MKKILPIEEKPSVSSFAHHAFFQSILEGNRLSAEDILRFNVHDLDADEWKYRSDNIRKESEGNKITYYANILETNAFSVMWRELKERDVFECDFEELVHICSNSGITVVVSEKDMADDSWRDHGYVSLEYIARNEIYLRRDGEILDIGKYGRDILMPLNVKVKNDDGKPEIAIFVGNEWVTLYSGTEEKEYRYIGIEADFKESEYQNWKNSNYIEFYCRPDGPDIVLDMYNSIKNGFMYMSNNQFLQVTPLEVNTIRSFPDGIKGMVKWAVNNDKYLVVWVDEYYIPNRNAYQKKHFPHCNMIYGYDDDTSTIYMMGYGKVYQSAEISYDDLTENFSHMTTKEDGALIALRRIPYNFVFSVDCIKKQIKAFLNGTSSFDDGNRIQNEPDIVFGKEAFTRMPEAEFARRKICRDVKVSQVLYEHSKLMSERIDFLRYRSHLPETKADVLKQKAENILHSSEKMRNLVIKNRMKDVYRDRIMDLFSEIGKMEEELLTDLYDSII